MAHLDLAQEVLDTIFGYLGFVVTIEIDRDANSLNVSTSDTELLIGHRGDRLDDIQYLANRIVSDRIPGAKKFRVDIDNYRATQEHRMIEEAEAVVERVLSTGEAGKLEPMNSYQRRVIHNHFKDHSDIKTWSPSDEARLKRISIIPKSPSQTADS